MSLKLELKIKINKLTHMKMLEEFSSDLNLKCCNLKILECVCSKQNEIVRECRSAHQKTVLALEIPILVSHQQKQSKHAEVQVLSAGDSGRGDCEYQRLNKR